VKKKELWGFQGVSLMGVLAKQCLPSGIPSAYSIDLRLTRSISEDAGFGENLASQ
jgi:hypothetical protein